MKIGRRSILISELIIHLLSTVYGWPLNDSDHHKDLEHSGQFNQVHTVVLVRHGESEGNADKLFSGWYDFKLTSKGIEEAKRAGIALKNAGYTFDVAFTSCLSRAYDTLNIILGELGLGEPEGIPVHRVWQLNERHYGDLTGFPRSKMIEEHGETQVHQWRRGFQTHPPEITEKHQHYDEIVKNPLYQQVLSEEDIPGSESLETCMERTIPYWKKDIVPQVEEGKKVLIVAHENTLRGLIMHLEDISPKDIMDLNLPNAVPFVFELNDDFKSVSLRFVGDVSMLAEAIKGTQLIRNEKRKEDQIVPTSFMEAYKNVTSHPSA